ncbi:MAG TPA: glycoside hydrolase family 5 protein [Ignavibacteriaceae bacterium]|nr:glycoside hydrolase family 5 protein [Ignavibacteriaceae bacterium]
MGKQIVTEDGKPLLLKGINLGNWLVPEGYMFKFENSTSPRLINDLFLELLGPEETDKFWKTYRDNYITKDDISFIKKTGFNSVRIPFNFRLFVREDTGIFTGPGFELLDRIIAWCREENIYVILDMHCAPCGQTGDNIDDSWGYPFLFESGYCKELTVELWGKIAGHYKDENILIGYDLLNEPIAPYFDTAELNPNLEPLYKDITKEIRKTDKNHLIFLGGAQWDSNFKIFGPPFDSKLVYTFHKYWTKPDQSAIQEYIDFRDKYNVPIWLGESGENKNQWISEFRSILEKNEIGWCFWPYKKLDASACIVSINEPEDYKIIISYADSDRNSYKKIRENKPEIGKVKKALSEYLENCKFKNCRINKDYVKALGLDD